MDLKKKMKAFFTLKRHANDGFTLVELIVVIAILAILGGVAVPAYSGYVDKANKGADQTTISEVRHALELYAYSNPGVTGGYVVLGQEGTAVKSDAVGAAAMEAVFGAGWEKVGLKYADWKGESSTLSYKESSYYGKESELIGTVDTLTNALGNAVVGNEDMQNLIFGGPFNDVLEKNNVDKDNGKAIGNAAVLYVAEQTKGKESDIQSVFSDILGPNGTVTNNTVNNIFTKLMEKGFGEVAAVAAIYAYAEGYAQYSGQEDKFHEMNFDGVENGATAATKLAQTLGSLDLVKFSTYVSSGQGSKDLKGYVDMMGTVVNNQDMVSGNINADNCFTDGTVENMLKGHAAMSSMSVATADGEVAVALTVDSNGMVHTYVTPMNWNK